MVAFKEEFNYFLEVQNELVEKYEGKVVVIKGREVLGVYDSEGEAFIDTAQAHELSTFMIQKIIAGPDAYTTRMPNRYRF